MPLGALTTYPYKLRPKMFLLRPVSARAPSAPLATPIVRDRFSV